MDRDALSSYEVRWHTDAGLARDDEPSEYLRSIRGRVVYSAGERSVIVGRLRATVIEIGRALDEGEDVAEVFDQTQELSHVCELLDPDEGWMIRSELNSGSQSDVLFLDRAELAPGHRGKGVGLVAVARTIEFFGRGCGIVVAKAFPLQHELAADRRRLAAYWHRLGFRDVGELLVMDLALRRPSIEEVLAELR